MTKTNTHGNRYWTKDLVLASARHFDSRAEWKRNELGAYKAARRDGWLEEAAAHMTPKKRDWDWESLKSSAKNYATRGAWKEAAPSAYKTALRKGILDVVCAHMAFARKPDGYWTKERVLESARRHPSIVAWDAAETTARQRALKNGWMEEATAQMSAVPMPIGPSTVHQFLMSNDIHYIAEHRFKEFPEVANKPFDFYLPSFNLIIEYHGKQHLHGWREDEKSKSAIQLNDKIKKDWASRQGISFLEIKAWKDKTQEQMLAKIVVRLKSLSKACGAVLTLTRRALTVAETKKIRSGLAWDEESILKDAAKYRSRADWMKHSPRAYRFALRHGLAEIATKDMAYITKHGKWTRETILESARKHQTMGAWRKAEGSAYVTAIRLGCLEEAKRHMVIKKKANGYWTKERVLVSARGCATMAEWRATESSARTAAMRNGWRNEACAHMMKRRKRGADD